MYSALFCYVPLGVLCGVMLSVFPWQVGPFEDVAADLVGKIKPGRYERIARMLKAYTLQTDRNFWDALDHLVGLWESLCQLRVFLQLLQVHCYHRKISGEDAQEVVWWAVLEIVFTLRSIPEAVICCIVPNYPHICAFIALSFHRDIMLRLQTLCAGESALPCLQALDSLL